MLYELKITRKFKYALYHNRTPLAYYNTKKDAKTALLLIKQSFDDLDQIQTMMRIQTVFYLSNTHLSVYKYCGNFELKDYFKVERIRVE